MTGALEKVLAEHFTAEQLLAIADAISKMPPEEQAEWAESFARFEERQKIVECQQSFMPFAKRMWPNFIEGRHHGIIAEAFDRIAAGKLKRLIINIAPRHTKSQFTSYLLPAWYLGRFPDRKIIQTSHTADLAVGFGRQVRNLVNSEEYQEVFPEVKLSQDSKAAGRWNTNKRGEYFAIGVGGAVTGKGADLLVVDDPHSEQEAALAQGNPEVYDKVYEWYMSGPRQRLQPGGSIAVIATRWSKRDLTGRLLRDMVEREGADQWEVIELPAILPSGNPLWPEFWPLEELLQIKATLPVHKWSAQYQQDPTAEEGALVKREWWKEWHGDPPQCEFVIQSWDTAMSKTERSNYSACTTWGIFHTVNEEGKQLSNLILLDAIAEKLEFPELKKRALELWKQWTPDSFIVEKKTSGIALISELRMIGIPVQEFVPSRGNDKIARVNAVTDLFSSGIVWAPPRRWAEEVIEQFAAFPAGENDDYVDSSTAALLRFRQGGFVRLESDEEDKKNPGVRRSDYY